MEFRKDKTYAFSKMMAYGFSKAGRHILADCHLYLGENSFEGVIEISENVFQDIIKKSDDKSGAFEKTCADWSSSDAVELFLPDEFPEPIHCKLTGLEFHFVKSELEDEDFDPERIFHFSLEPQNA